MKIQNIKSKALAAFSLIELMVVIAIVAILTAVALPSYQTYIAQSKASEIAGLASDQMSKWVQYNTSGLVSSTNTVYTNTLGNYINSAQINSTNVQLQLLSGTPVTSDLGAAFASAVITLVPIAIATATNDAANQTYTWKCYYYATGGASTTIATYLGNLGTDGNACSYNGGGTWGNALAS